MNFGSSTPWSLGVEEELFLVDPVTLDTAPVFDHGVGSPPRLKPELFAVYGAKEGCFVLNVSPGKPAAKAGIRPEDIITAVDGKPIKDGTELVNRISDLPVGSAVKP